MTTAEVAPPPAAPAAPPPAAPNPPPANPVPNPPPAAPPANPAAVVPPATPPAAPLALADDPDDERAPAPTDFPQDWRQKIAGEDKKLLKTLERVTDPGALGKQILELQKLAGKKAERPQKPGEGATPEEIAAYRAEIGAPEKHEAYVENVKLPDGRVLGEEDKAVATDFAAAVFGADYSQQQFDAAMDWYTKHVETVHAQQAEADDTLKAESRVALKEEWGADYKRNINAVGHLFTDAPAGFKDRLFAARDAEGKLLGNDPEFLRWASKIALDVNPAATIIPPGQDATASIATERASLEKMMGDRSSEYWKGPNADRNQARYRELVSAQEKLSKR